MSRAWWERPLPGAEAFAGLCADLGDVVRCGPSGDEAGGGRGLFATAAVAKGATIFREKPAVLVQDPRNRAETRACGCCHAMLAETSPSVAQPSCAWGCGERYCDETCADTHVRELGHRVFCVGPLESWDHPVAALRLAAARDDDQDGLLALVQEMAARVLHEAHAAIANDDRQTRADADADAEAEDDVAAATAAASLAWFVRGGAGEGSPVAFESARCRVMSALVADAAAAAIADTENERFVAGDGSDRTGGDDDARERRRRRAKTTARLRAVATRAFCARGVSALATLATRNQLSVVVRSDRPVTSPVTSRDNHSVARPVVDEAATATYDGLAVFPLTCLMNHGCAPNAETRFDDAVVADAVVADDVVADEATFGAARASPPRARVVALRDVAAGEELTHAYVDVTRPAQVRAAALAGFGFKCDCEKCARAFGG